MAAVPLLLAAGCRWGPADESSTTPEPDAPKAIPDSEQVEAAVAAIAEVQDFVEAASAKHIGLSEPLAELTSLHTAHLALLDPDRAAGTTDVAVPGTSGAALAAVRRREATLQSTLSGLAADVSSGPLARTLAAVAAGVAQHRQLLPTVKVSAP
ncbi:hypothetical protein ASG90_06115 [Nocardioides sp. Soil797]|nr:hypothetical protein ASG90_06115 [Nocardioides sp. Soil797]